MISHTTTPVIDQGRSPALLSNRFIRTLRWLTALPLLAVLALPLRADLRLLSRPFIEDSFYSLTVARFLGLGQGMTIDGEQATNGIQPLIVLLYAPLYGLSGGDVFVGLRLASALQGVLFAGAVMAIARFAATLVRERTQRRGIFWLVAAVSAWSLPLQNQMLNGLETGLAVGLAFAAAAFYNDRSRGGETELGLAAAASLGGLLGLGVLARIDVAMLVVAVVGYHIFRGARSGRGELRRRLLKGMVIGGTALLVSSPWWVYNYVTFGSLMPISGQAQQALNPDRWSVIHVSLAVLSDAFVPTTHVPFYALIAHPGIGTLVFALLIALVLAASGEIGRVGDAARGWRAFWRGSGFVPVGLFSIGLFIFYTFFFGAPHFQVRYLVPLRVALSLGVITFLYLAFRSNNRRSHRLLALLAAGAGALTAMGFTANFTIWREMGYAERALWVVRNVAAGERVGTFQSGVTAYLSPTSVVNLDGKVNAAALRALKEGRMTAYIDSADFDYLVDWPELIGPVVDEPRFRGRYQLIDSLPDRTLIYRRVR